ncbi:MAG: cupin domain-containing protein [Actinomycetota bacterium]|nr:cupin domain-containing protein [Actinomycetota bacterium]
MRRISITNPQLAYDADDPEGFRAGMFRPGPALGAKNSGATVYELPPGQAICPYHYEYGEEEWLLVLSGRPTLRTPEGETELVSDDLAFFPKGPEGAHQIRNDTGEPARVLMWSTIVVPSATAYPDSDKVGIWTGVEGEDLMAPRSANVDYYSGER